MHKKTILIIGSIFLLVCFITGCVDNKSVDYTNNYIPSENFPVGIIDAPTKAYFDETIEFDASESYDVDGRITSYIWNFMDGTVEYGKKVKHTFQFTNEFNIEYPLIYTVTLFVVDNDDNFKPTIHQIMLYPKKFVFYFDIGKISSIKPTSHSEGLKSQNILVSSNQRHVTYELQETVNIPKCEWNIMLNIEKPFLSIINKLTITFYDYTGEIIGSHEEKLGFNNFWRQKTIQINGFFEKNIELKSVKISTSCFPANTNIKIYYGSKIPSELTFAFDDY